jgi:hypothetical protein
MVIENARNEQCSFMRCVSSRVKSTPNFNGILKNTPFWDVTLSKLVEFCLPSGKPTASVLRVALESVINRAASADLANVSAEQLLLLPHLFLQAVPEYRWM